MNKANGSRRVYGTMSKWSILWPFVAAVFQVCFAGYLLGMTNNKLSEAVVADIDLAGEEAARDRLLVGATDPAAKRDLEEDKANLVKKRAALREVRMQASALSQAIALGILAVASFCLASIIRPKS